MHATTTIGLTKHAAQRMRERIPALAGRSHQTLQANAGEMLTRAVPFCRPTQEMPWRRLMLCRHEQSGTELVLVVDQQKGSDCLLVITCLSIQQARSNLDGFRKFNAGKKTNGYHGRRRNNNAVRIDSSARKLRHSGHRQCMDMDDQE